MSLFWNTSSVLSFLCSNPNGLTAQSQRHLMAYKALNDLASSCLSDSFLKTCSFCVSHTSLPCVLLTYLALICFTDVALTFSLPRTFFQLIPPWLISINLYSDFIFLVKLSLDFYLNQFPFTSTPLLLSLFMCLFFA